MATHPRRLEDLLSYPREDLDVEYKSWIDLTDDSSKAVLAQALLALANHGGGHVVVGFAETDGTLVPDPARPPSLAGFTQDAVNGIVLSYAEPGFQCAVDHVRHPMSGMFFPVVSVPPGRTPVRARRDGPHQKHVKENTYYIRRPGPKSEPPRTARDWDELIGRCLRSGREALLEELRQLLSPDAMTGSTPSTREILTAWAEESEQRFLALVRERLGNESPSRFAHGTWSVTYVVENAPPVGDLAELKDLLVRCKGHETGWPPWWVPTRTGIAPYVADGAIECWLAEPEKDPGHSDFWRARPDGRLFLLRGHQEDGITRLSTKQVLDGLLPIWHVGECLLHASRTAAAFGVADHNVAFRFRWSGLKGRQLRIVTNEWEYSADFFEGHVSEQDEVAPVYTVRADLIEAGLEDAVARVTRPLYESFGFFRFEPMVVKRELNKLRQRATR